MEGQLRKNRRWTTLPMRGVIRAKISNSLSMDLYNLAEVKYEISPSVDIEIPSSYYLPNQLRRITNVVHTDDFEGQILGGVKRKQGPCVKYIVKDVTLLDGVLYKKNAWRWFHERTSRFPKFIIENEISHASVYTTGDGIRYFGQWLAEDCVTYPLAQLEGAPLTTAFPPTHHMIEYERLLGMNPIRLDSAYIRELVLFKDGGQTENKHKRFRNIVNTLLSKFEVNSHPGVFILRRDSGEKRILTNEIELAEKLSETRGFKIVDVTRDDLNTILRSCVGAEVVVGVEGSQLMHGLMVLKPGKSVLVLQPPDRFCGTIKRTTDREKQHYGFVVGEKEELGFSIDIDEVERTLDLFPVQ